MHSRCLGLFYSPQSLLSATATFVCVCHRYCLGLLCRLPLLLSGSSLPFTISAVSVFYHTINIVHMVSQPHNMWRPTYYVATLTVYSTKQKKLHIQFRSVPSKPC